MPGRTPNRLGNETSPYLVQHAYNPVDWYPWCDEALERARRQDMPIFLSIGYSACHWCHVMERESFEDEEIARLLNAHFVCIKVDREERPDLDEIYMTAVQALIGSGGWPMSVFLTPVLEPFFAGTYFPPEDRFGRPGFRRVVAELARLWDTQRNAIQENATVIARHVRDTLSAPGSHAGSTVTADVLDAASGNLAQTFDEDFGGWGSAPKFPSASAIRFLLRHYVRTGEVRNLRMATATLDAMALGGLYDHLGGGFHRYSTDERWLVPHFEKMLYDNAQLAEAYIEAYQVTHKPLYRRVAEETLEYVLRDMRDLRGGFHSSEDADSESEEGRFYLWTYGEIIALLGASRGEVFCDYYGVRPAGNFASGEPAHAGRSILHVAHPRAEPSGLRELRARLFEARNARVRPNKDDKVLTSWNALMIGALAKAARVFGCDTYRDAARDAAAFLMSEMFDEAALYRVYRAGRRSTPGYLDDYAYLASALLDLYEATFEVRWVVLARELADQMIARFWDDHEGGFYFTAGEHTDLIARSKPLIDGAEPSGNAVAASCLLHLAGLTGDPSCEDKAAATVRLAAVMMQRAPQGLLRMLCAADWFLAPRREIAVAGGLDNREVRQFLRVLAETFIPNRTLALADPSSDPLQNSVIPFLNGKQLIEGRPAVYICENAVCQQPLTSVEALRNALGLQQPGGSQQ